MRLAHSHTTAAAAASMTRTTGTVSTAVSPSSRARPAALFISAAFIAVFLLSFYETRQQARGSPCTNKFT